MYYLWHVIFIEGNTHEEILDDLGDDRIVDWYDHSARMGTGVIEYNVNK